MMRRFKSWFVYLCIGLASVLSGTASAATYWDSYLPPEVAFADDLRQHVTVPSQVDINKSTLGELQVLPGFDEEIALKILRARPFEDIQDFYRKLPGLNKKNIDRLIQQVQPKLRFN